MEDILKEIALFLCRRKVIPTFVVRALAEGNKKRRGEYSNSAYKAFLRCLFNTYLIEYIHDSYGGNIKVFINFLNQSRVMTGNTYEEDTAYVIERFVKPGDVVLDVGANVGAIALLLAKKVAPSGKVYAFEPGLSNFNHLWKNLNLNPELKKVTLPINLGLSDCKGELSYVEDSRNRGNATLVNIDDKNYWSTSFLENYGLKETIETVCLTTIDSFFNEYPLNRLDFIKIDVEGMEYNVLRGGA